MYYIRLKAPRLLLLLVLLAALLAACDGSSGRENGQSQVQAAQDLSAADADDHGEDSGEAEAAHDEADAAASDDHAEAEEQHEDMAAAHDIPAEAAGVENPVEASEASVSRGTELFQTNCVICHGLAGAGDGPAAAGLEPKPANLSDGHVQENTDGSLFYVISEGSAGTAMPPWKTIINDEDRWHLVNFIRTLEGEGAAEMAAMPMAGHDTAEADAHTEGEPAASDEHDESSETHEDLAEAHGIPPEAVNVENPVQPDEASVARGTELFQTNCTVCHGPEGAGDGLAAAGLEPKPANLSDGHVQENSDGSLFYIISEGSAGTAMPAWKTIISDEDRWRLVNFLRTLPESE